MKFPSQLDPWLGRLIGNCEQYRLDERLETGGMANVFLATDTLLGKQVVLKLLKDTLVGSRELRKRFEWEVALYAALKSDHIVEVNDYGVTAEGHPFYVMDYLRGQSLKQLQQQQRLTVERTISIIIQVCDGLHLAHEGVTLRRDGTSASQRIKVVHCNLKPDNIFLVSTSVGELVKILDFSIAKIDSDCVEQTDLTSKFIGTFRYAAPEQLRVALDLDGRADIYSLGIILYEMLSSTDPFGFGIKSRSMSGVSWALAHTSKPPIPLRSQPGLSQLSLELEAVVMRCLQKVPDERFASVDELKRALQAAVAVGGGAIPQLPTPSGQSEATIAQTAPLHAQVPDVTIAQTTPPHAQVPDVTIAQTTPPHAQLPDVTIAQTAPPHAQLPDVTIAQTAPPHAQLPDVTIAQTAPPHAQLPDVTIAQTAPSLRLAVPVVLQKLFGRIAAILRIGKRQ